MWTGGILQGNSPVNTSWHNHDKLYIQQQRACHCQPWLNKVIYCSPFYLRYFICTVTGSQVISTAHLSKKEWVEIYLHKWLIVVCLPQATNTDQSLATNTHQYVHSYQYKQCTHIFSWVTQFRYMLSGDVERMSVNAAAFIRLAVSLTR
jgi:hypothetical protein